MLGRRHVPIVASNSKVDISVVGKEGTAWDKLTSKMTVTVVINVVEIVVSVGNVWETLIEKQMVRNWDYTRSKESVVLDCKLCFEEIKVWEAGWSDC